MPNIFYGWIIVAAAVLIGFLTTGLSGYANGILLPQLADALAEGSRGQISIGFSISTFLAALISPWVGRHADNHSPRRVLLLGVGLIALSYVGIASAQSIWQFYLAKGVLFGAGIAMAGPLVRNLIVAHWFERMRGRALGFSVLGASIAGVVLPLILNEMVNELGWRTTVYLFGFAVAVMLSPTVYFILKDRPEEIGEVRDGNAPESSVTSTSPRNDEDERKWSWADLLKSRAFWATGLVFGPMFCVYIVIMVHLFGHVVASGLKTEQAALVLSVVALFSLTGKPIIGFMADFVGARITLWTSLILQGTALFVFTISSELWHFTFSAAMYGLGYAALSPMRTYVLAANIGTKSLGTAVGLLKWLELPFGIAASPIAGFVYDATGSYDSAFLVFAGFIVLGCIGPFFIKDDRAARLWERLTSLTSRLKRGLQG